MKRFINFNTLTFIILSTFISCNVYNENLILGYFSNDNKNITIVSGSDPLIVGIKSSLLINGWQVLTFPENEDQSTIDFTNIETKYILLSDYEQGYDLIYGDFVKEYNFTIYDTDTGFEVVILYGEQRTVDKVVEDFKYIISNNYES